MELSLAWLWARRELRGGIRGFRIFLACLILGVAVIAGVGSINASIDAGLTTDARALLGGDVELHLVHRTATSEELAYLQKSGTVSQISEMRAMARTEEGAKLSLIELRGVDSGYPLYGAVALDPAQPLAAALANRDGHWGFAAAPRLIATLGLHLGDTIKIGDAHMVLHATLVTEPDAPSGNFALGPHVMIAAPALSATGLIMPGTLIDYSYRVKLRTGTDAKQWIADIRTAFPEAGWRIREPGDSSLNLMRLLDRVSLFLTLVGLTALLVGGVGIANAVRAYLATKMSTIATLKAMGAPSRLIFATYFIQILVLALVGILGGLILGALVPLASLPFLPPAWTLPSRLGLYPGPLALAGLFGLLTTITFSLWPIAAACEVRPSSLFRALIEPPSAPPARVYRLATGLAAVTLATLAVTSAQEHGIAFWFILGAILSLLIFRLLARLLMGIARRIRHVRRPALRLALANLHRPGAPTAGIVASLGLGLSVLVAITVIEANLANLIEEDLPDRAPSFFFIDLQPDQKPAFDQLLAHTPGVLETDSTPSLRGRITRLNGVPVEQIKITADARWTLESERGLTYTAKLPRGSRITAGKWWDADYHGAPLVSMDGDIARGLGLKLGDTVTVDVLGHALTAELASLRVIDWGSLGINFVMIFSPGSLDGVPQTFIATARATQQEELPLEQAVAERFPNVSAIPVKDILAQLGDIVGAIATALRATSAIALIAGTLVLAGAVAAGHRRRVYEAVLLKVLGATRGDITRAFLIEYALLGLATMIIAIGIGTLSAYLVVTRVMHAEWAFYPGVALATSLIGGILTLAIGYAGTWLALGAKAAPYLRNE